MMPEQESWNHNIPNDFAYDFFRGISSELYIKIKITLRANF